MLYSWMQLILMLLLILLSAHTLTNALEYAGQKLNISEGVTGSLFAAVATALPEASVPIIALFAGTNHAAVNEEITVGAILGAPLMLTTLSLFLMACAVLKTRGFKGRLQPEKKGLVRDLNFFLIAFSLAAIAMYIPHETFLIRVLIGALLVALYIVYLAFTLKASKKLVADGHGVVPEDPLLLTKIGLKDRGWVIVAQIILALGLLFLSVKGFVHGIEHISSILHVSALLLSLLIIPIATELPEKVNSILWIRRGKDTLAFGNITGAMVFQGTLLPALGIWLTPWHPSKEVLWGIIVALVATAWLRINIALRPLSVGVLLFNGALYVTYLWVTLH
jgi:cation:H+ antiporter